MVIPNRWKLVSGGLTLSVAIGASSALAGETGNTVPSLEDVTLVTRLSEPPSLALLEAPVGAPTLSNSDLLSSDTPDDDETTDTTDQTHPTHPTHRLTRLTRLTDSPDSPDSPGLTRLTR